MTMAGVSTTTVTLNNGVKMPQFGISVGQLPAGENTENAVKWALEAGYRHIDTAANTNNEESVGKAIRESGVPRGTIFIATKLWNTNQGYESTLEAFETSRKKLDVDYIDLYLIHWPKSKEAIAKDGKLYLDTWRAFEKLYAEKKVRAIGVSNFKEHHLDDIFGMCTVPPMVNQVELHPLNSQPGLRAYCADKKIQVESWSPLGLGKLVGNPVLMSMAEKYHKTLNQIILRWDIQRNIVTIPMSKTNKERIASNTDVFDFELTEDELAQIDALNANARNCPDPDEADC